MSDMLFVAALICFRVSFRRCEQSSNHVCHEAWSSATGRVAREAKGSISTFCRRLLCCLVGGHCDILCMRLAAILDGVEYCRIVASSYGQFSCMHLTTNFLAIEMIFLRLRAEAIFLCIVFGKKLFFPFLFVRLFCDVRVGQFFSMIPRPVIRGQECCATKASILMFILIAVERRLLTSSFLQFGCFS